MPKKVNDPLPEESDTRGSLIKAASLNKTSRLLINCFLAELFYLPYFHARSWKEQAFVEREINQVLNLKRAVDEGIIEDWSLKWVTHHPKQWPRYPKLIRIYFKKGINTNTYLSEDIRKEIARIRESGDFMMEKLTWGKIRTAKFRLD
jgi:hypothetical protein